NCSFCFMIFFFFQAEDGIRDKLVTGVQTCALPISSRTSTTFLKQVWEGCGGSGGSWRYVATSSNLPQPPQPFVTGFPDSGPGTRSEERRVGKECRARGATYH